MLESLLERFIRVAYFIGDARNTDVAAFLEWRYNYNDWALLLETEWRPVNVWWIWFEAYVVVFYYDIYLHNLSKNYRFCRYFHRGRVPQSLKPNQIVGYILDSSFDELG